MAPHLITDPARLPGILALLHRACAGMEGRIDPPSSLHRLTVADLAAAWEVWAIAREDAPSACMVLTPKPRALHVGKLAVDPGAQRRGHARALIATAEARARALGLPTLELQTRVELSENHATFAALGFHETARTTYPGYPRPTAITLAKAVAR